MSEVVNVEIAEMKIGHNPDVLVTSALGSCIGITLYDPALKIGGLAHIMLPETKMAKEGANPAKFADTAIEAMLEGMIKLGAKHSRIEAKIIGGARMFSSASSNPLLDIGTRNVAAAKHVLHRKRIRLVAEDTGEDYARCIEFSCFSGKVKVRSLKRGEKEL